MARFTSQIVHWMALAAATVLGLQAPTVAAQGAFLEQNGSQFLGAPLFLNPGVLEVEMYHPKLGDLSFSAESVLVDFLPGSLHMPSTPYGQALLFDAGNPSTPEYTLAFLDFGINIALSPSPSFHEFEGSLAGLTAAVSPAPVNQDPGGTTSVTGGGKFAGKPGWNWIQIHSTRAGASFRQFVTISVEWEGEKNGFPIRGKGGVKDPITGNNGQEVNMDGSTTYVDSNRSITGANTPQGYNPTADGDYLSQTAGGTTTMTDAPNMVNPAGIVADILAGAPGVTLKKIKMRMNFTTYVICAGAIKSKVKWSYIEEIEFPAIVPHWKSGGYGGPGVGPGQPRFTAGGIPTTEPANAMEPHHAAAHGKYMGGTYSGAPSNGADY